MTQSWLLFAIAIASLSWPSCVRALIVAEVDTANTYRNVGARFGADASNNRLGLCSGTLIHERLFLTAGHCAGPPPSGLRGYVTFSAVDGKNPSTWFEVVEGFRHPSMGGNSFVPRLAAGVSDVGLLVSAEPVRGIAPARLGLPHTVSRVSSGTEMTLVGYGCGPAESWDGMRKVGRYTLFDAYSNEWLRFLRTPSGNACPGDSGGPTSHEGHIVDAAPRSAATPGSTSAARFSVATSASRSRVPMRA